MEINILDHSHKEKLPFDATTTRCLGNASSVQQRKTAGGRTSDATALQVASCLFARRFRSFSQNYSGI